MCGRVVYVWDPITGELVMMIDDGALDDPARKRVLEKKRYNVPPSSHLPVFAALDGKSRVEIARWGFPIPARPNGVFNTRIESAAESPLWRGMLGKSHCVFPVKGFYEWEQTAAMRPFFVQRADGRPMLLAGLLGRRDVKGESELCASVVTCAPNRAMATLHDRMPVILEEADLQAWLRPEGVDAALELAVPAGDVLAIHQVGPAVNSTKNDGPELLEPSKQRTLGF